MGTNEDMQLVPVDAEQEQLDVLLSELARIEGQQTKLRDAVTHSQAIVVHPRREAYEEELSDDSPVHRPPSPTKIVASAGLIGFSVAQDLLTVDFSTPEEAPEEFRAMPFNRQKSLEIKPGLSGSFGVMDPASQELLTYLKRLEEQQRQVLELIAGKKRELTASRLGSSKSVRKMSQDLATSTGRQAAEGLQTSTSKRDNRPPSRGGTLVRMESSRQKGAQSLEDRRDNSVLLPAGPSASIQHLAIAMQHKNAASPPAGPRILDADARTLSSIEQWREKAKEMGGGTSAIASGGRKLVTLKKSPEPKEKAPDAVKFAAKSPDVRGLSLPSRFSPLGVLHVLFFVACFGFYLFCRSTTMSATKVQASVLAYQIIFVLGECFLFLTATAFAISKMRILYPSNSPLDSAGTVQRNGNETAPEEAMSHVSAAPSQLQVLIFGGNRNIERLQMALRAVLEMELPAGCSRTIHLVDPTRDASKEALVATLGQDVQYTPASIVPSQARKDLGRAQIFNRVLGSIYPKDAAISRSDYVMILDDDQVVDKLFLKKLLPYFKNEDVRLVYLPPAFENISVSQDVFNQLQESFCQSILPGYEAWGYGASANAAFIVRADALQAVNWFPTYSTDVGLALGIELKIARFLAKFHNEALVKGLAPSTVAGVYDMQRDAFLGHYTAFFFSRPAHRGSLLMRFRIIFHSRAWSQIAWAALLPLFVLVPIIRVFFDYFPFVPNKWVGLGFVIYYLIATPSIYVHLANPRTVLSLWHWIVAYHSLYFVNLATFWAGLFHSQSQQLGPVGTMAVDDARLQKAADTVVNIDAVSVTRKATTPVGEGGKVAARDQPHPLRAFPFGSALICGLSLSTVGVGCWLLFGGGGRLSSRSTIADTAVDLKTNLDLVLSILWAGVYAAIFSIPVFYSTFTVFSGLSYDYYRRPANKATGPMSRSTGIWSSACFALSMCLMILAVIACLGLGRGFDSITVVSQSPSPPPIPWLIQP